MSTKLKDETELLISHGDLADILTGHFCSSSYDAFANLRVGLVEFVPETGTFCLTMTPGQDERKRKIEDLECEITDLKGQLAEAVRSNG